MTEPREIAEAVEVVPGLWHWALGLDSSAQRACDFRLTADPVPDVPLGWRVTVTCTNAGSMRHSCAIVRGPMTAVPAFAGATTPDPVLGLEKGKTARFTFTASRAGTYRIACLVPGHEEARMWDVLVVGGVKRPTIQTRAGF